MSSPAAPSPLDRSSCGDMVRSAIAALPDNPDASPEDLASRREATVAALAALNPRDPVEAMLAARIVAAHHAAMECFRRAAQPDTADNVALRLHAKAISLANLSSRTLRELRQLQAAAPAHPVPEQLPETKSQPQPPVGAPTEPTRAPLPPTQPTAALPPSQAEAARPRAPTAPAALAA